MADPVWAVVFSRGYPTQVLALYSNEEAAARHAGFEGDEWRAERWTVETRFEEPNPDE